MNILSFNNRRFVTNLFDFLMWNAKEEFWRFLYPFNESCCYWTSL